MLYRLRLIIGEKTIPSANSDGFKSSYVGVLEVVEPYILYIIEHNEMFQ